MNKNQNLINFLYKQLLTQYERYTYLKNIGISSTNIRLKDEEQILYIYLEMYKNFYKNIIVNICTKLKRNHLKKQESFFMHGIEYDNIKYKSRMEDIANYNHIIDNMTCEDAINSSFLNISSYIDYKYKKYLFEPEQLKK